MFVSTGGASRTSRNFAGSRRTFSLCGELLWLSWRVMWVGAVGIVKDIITLFCGNRFAEEFLELIPSILRLSVWYKKIAVALQIVLIFFG